MEEQIPNTAQGAWSLAIGEQIQNTARSIHQIFYPPPSSEPGNESTAPLFSPLYQGDDIADARREDQRPSGAGPTLMLFVKFFITMAPLFTVFLSWAILLGIGLDPLAFGMLAFYLLMALLGCIMLIADIQIRLARRQRAKDRQHGAIIQEPIPKPPKDWKHILYISLGILAVYILFYGIIWMWATISDDGNDNGLPSPWHVFVVSRNLQEKIGGPSSIEQLGACLQEAIPHRIATIADVSRCLRIMGMKPFYEG